MRLFEDGVPRRVERPGGERRVQPADALCRAAVARSHRAARGREVSAPGGVPVQPGADGRGAVAQSAYRVAPSCGCSMRASIRATATGATRPRCEGRNARSTRRLAKVPSLDDDRIIRRFRNVIEAMLRTNFFQSGRGRHVSDVAGVQDRQSKIEDLPLPRPMVEIFVYSPEVEGVHLRFGKVARGGIRWSDRREDFRTEVLGPRQSAAGEERGHRAGRLEGRVLSEETAAGVEPRSVARPRGVAAYKTFIASLLDLTDNIAAERQDRSAARTSCARTATILISSSRPTRARRRSRTSPTASRPTTGSGSAMRSRAAARSATTTRRWASPPRARGRR